MKKLRNWMNTPITWGAYWKWAGIYSVIAIIGYLIWMTIIGVISPVRWINKKIDSIKGRFHR